MLPQELLVPELIDFYVFSGLFADFVVCFADFAVLFADLAVSLRIWSFWGGLYTESHGRQRNLLARPI